LSIPAINFRISAKDNTASQAEQLTPRTFPVPFSSLATPSQPVGQSGGK
jgi:hypothetical protein